MGLFTSRRRREEEEARRRAEAARREREARMAQWRADRTEKLARDYLTATLVHPLFFRLEPVS